MKEVYVTNNISNISGGRQPAKSLISKAKIKSVKMTGVLIVGFILTWTPYQIASLW
jgi:hypothetical protein